MGEVMGQWVEPAEDELEDSLQRRQSQHHHHRRPSTTDTSFLTDYKPPSDESTTLDRATSVHLDTAEGVKDEWTTSGGNSVQEIQDLDRKVVDSEIAEVLTSFINAQDLEDKVLPHYHTNSNDKRVHKEINHSEEEKEEEEEEEIIELEFERAINKLDTHTMHCPKCNNQVTKVILRRKRKITPKKHKPLNLLGCLPCLSLFIPTGKGFNMFGIFGNELKEENYSSTTITKDDANVVIQEKGDCCGLFRTFLNKLNSEKVEHPQQTSAVDIKRESPIDPTRVTDNKVIEKGDQGQDSKGIDVAKRRNTAYYAYSWLRQHGKSLGSRLTPQGVIRPRNVKLDVQGDSEKNALEAKLLSKHNNESEEKQNAVDSRLKGIYEVYKAGDLRLDVQDDSEKNAIEAKLLSKHYSEIEEKQDAVQSWLEEGYIRSRDGGGLIDQQITIPSKKTSVPFNYQNYKPNDEIIKSIVYGGLMESITSLSIVASAAATDANTLSILTLGMAFVFGGLIYLGHSLWQLKDEESSKYQEVMGKRENFSVHATFAMLSFFIFGVIPPITYGFSFRNGDNKDMKILGTFAAALLSVILLAIGKAYAQNKSKLFEYIKTITYYIALSLAVSGVSFISGHLIKEFAEDRGFSLKLTYLYGWFSEF